jgi:hypothetical protein
MASWTFGCLKASVVGFFDLGFVREEFHRAGGIPAKPEKNLSTVFFAIKHFSSHVTLWCSKIYHKGSRRTMVLAP